MGRATDAVVLVDERHVPYVPGSAIKGLCKWQACRLIDAYPILGPKPEPPATGPVFEILDGGTDLKHAENRVWFDHAYPEAMEKIRTACVGRSARDRVSGRARDQHLFFYEDASPAEFSTTLACDDNLSPAALLLLVLSLRRIEALGGQRRRGKGRCSCRVHVLDPGSVAELAGLVLPSSDASHADRFRRFANSILGGLSALAEDPVDEEGHAAPADGKAPPAPDQTRSEQACWIQTCKRYPGAYGAIANAVHGVVDRLHSSGDACAECGAAWKPADGYFQLEGDADSVKIVLGRPPARVFQRTARRNHATRQGSCTVFAEVCPARNVPGRLRLGTATSARITFDGSLRAVDDDPCGKGKIARARGGGRLCPAGHRG